MVPLVFFAASCFIGGKKIHVWKRQEATHTSLPNGRDWYLALRELASQSAADNLSVLKLFSREHATTPCCVCW